MGGGDSSFKRVKGWVGGSSDNNPLKGDDGEHSILFDPDSPEEGSREGLGRE